VNAFSKTEKVVNSTRKTGSSFFTAEMARRDERAEAVVPVPILGLSCAQLSRGCLSLSETWKAMLPNFGRPEGQVIIAPGAALSQRLRKMDD
jgi:hypothetical protein